MTLSEINASDAELAAPPADACADTRSAPANIAFYDNAIPPFAEAELERLYQCVMTTLARFDIYAAAPAASTYVAREDGRITTLFLFRRERHRVTVYNEQIPIDAAEIKRFADAVFARYRSVRRISFYAIDTRTDAIGYPLQCQECLEDIVLALPRDPASYLSALGKNMRASIKRYHNKVQRDFPSFRFQVYDNGSAHEQQIRQIVAFNRQRMLAKGEVSYYTERSTEQLARLVRRYGVVAVATIDGKLAAGVICFRVGASYLMWAVAHDPRYDDYRLGKLCCYLSIVDAIEHAGKEYHLGWGRYDYKFKLLGRLKALYRVELYRSHLHMFGNAPDLLKMAFAAELRKLKLRLANAERGDSLADRCLRRLAAGARAVKRLRRRSPSLPC
jgi:hypothetical protein